MRERQENLLQTAARWAGTTLFFASLLAVSYHALVAAMGLFVPTDKKSRQALAKRLHCDPLVLAEGLAAWTICYAVIALMWGFVAVLAFTVLFE